MTKRTKILLGVGAVLAVGGVAYASYSAKKCPNGGVWVPVPGSPNGGYCSSGKTQLPDYAGTQDYTTSGGSGPPGGDGPVTSPDNV